MKRHQNYHVTQVIQLLGIIATNLILVQHALASLPAGGCGVT